MLPHSLTNGPRLPACYESPSLSWKGFSSKNSRPKLPCPLPFPSFSTVMMTI